MSQPTASSHPQTHYPDAVTPGKARPAETVLPTYRLHLMRGGYLLMAAGLMIVKWPLFSKQLQCP
ncbi:hypothetical protein [Arthrobacter sp. MW3 TE3886]|jgi:hypothetical protein|uniref:hypothetical protein n=1 Tax=Arthrobacter sp. MW3 TE3886 TaxID=3156254 RepID=UPI003517C74E